MKLIVISSAAFVENQQEYLAYSPYIKEMELWAKHSDAIAFACPVLEDGSGLLLSKVNFRVARIFRLKAFNLLTIPELLKAFLYSFYNFYILFRAMLWADHIHLRCPGNIGLMGCIVQIFFPSKPKTAKYAGNWDPNAKQPWSYKLQRAILSNTLLTKNMQVLVYGEWKGQSKNIKSFFTASYKESDKEMVLPRNLDATIDVVFVGTLSSGKRPLYAIRLIEALRTKDIDIKLSLYGNGAEKAALQQYIAQNQLENFIHLKGNQPQEIVKEAYKKSHFVLLPSQSEGWPKVIAEGMFWGCLPIASKVSCLENMLDHGKRGLLLDLDFDKDVAMIEALINDTEAYSKMARESIDWSRHYTLEKFENEIRLLLQP